MNQPCLRAVPFLPVIFNPEIADLSLLIAPPYDVIDEASCAELLSRHPYNIVRLILPPSLNPDVETRYSDAANLWQQWSCDNILLELDEPSLFVYAQRFSWQGRTKEHWTLLCTLPLSDYSTGLIRPHEQTMPKPKSDRLKLLWAMGAELGQVHAILSDETGEWDELLQATAQGKAWLYAAADGVEHLVWKIPDIAFAEAVNRLLKGQWLVIADGHHRYEAGLAFRSELPEAQANQNHPANFIGAVISDCRRSTTMLPTHRLLRFRYPKSVERVLRELMRCFSTFDADFKSWEQQFAEGSPADFSPFLFAAQGQVKGVFVYGIEGGIAQALGQLPPALRKVDTAVLHQGLLPIIMTGAGVKPDEVELSYTHDEATAKTFAEQPDCLAIFLRPLPLSLVHEVAQHNLRLPPKTTYFVPKVPSGLVMRQLL